MLVRAATLDDLPQILAIYNDVIATSTAVYADRPATLQDRAEWFAARGARNYPVLVAIEHDRVLGFSSFGDWRGAWSAYRHTIEHSVHVTAQRRGGGVGGRLVEALFPLAAAMNMHVMVGGIDAANGASRRFHQHLGFAEVAHFHEVGRKFNRGLDLVFAERFLDRPGTEPRG